MAQDIQSASIPIQLREQAASRYNMRFIVGGILLLAFVGFLGFQMVRATTTTGAYFMTVNELLADPNIQGQRVRVNGNVVPGTEDWNAQDITLKFSISDETMENVAVSQAVNAKQLPIVFYGTRTHNFQRAASAIIEGELLPDGTFQADTLLLKCPSRYEEEPSEVFAKSTR